MPRRKRPEATQGQDGRWHLWVTVGTKANGRPDQRHASGVDKDAAEDAADELLDTVRATGRAPKAGKKPTVQSWFATYFDVVLPRKNVDPTTIYGYRGKVRLYVLPVIGARRLDQLTADDLDRVYLGMQRAGLADSHVRQVHRILSRAFKIAWKRGLMTVNPADLLEDAPTAKKIEMQSLTEEAAVAILDATTRRRNAARWSVGLALGLRQGEALGLRWPYVELDGDEPHLRVWWQLHRRPFEHGCAPPCGRRRAGNCPQRRLPLRTGEIHLSGGLILKEPKGKSKRTVPIPPELVEQLRTHREVQDFERMMLPEGVYAGHGLVFAREDGAPTDPGDDWSEWKTLLGIAEVPDARVHDARHTAATLLIAQGVRLEVVQELLGHSSITTTRGYAHVASEMAKAGIEALGKKLLRGTGASG